MWVSELIPKVVAVRRTKKWTKSDARGCIQRTTWKTRSLKRLKTWKQCNIAAGDPCFYPEENRRGPLVEDDERDEETILAEIRPWEDHDIVRTWMEDHHPEEEERQAHGDEHGDERQEGGLVDRCGLLDSRTMWSLRGWSRNSKWSRPTTVATEFSTSRTNRDDDKREDAGHGRPEATDACGSYLWYWSQRDFQRRQITKSNRRRVNGTNSRGGTASSAWRSEVVRGEVDVHSAGYENFEDDEEFSVRPSGVCGLDGEESEEVRVPKIQRSWSGRIHLSFRVWWPSCVEGKARDRSPRHDGDKKSLAEMVFDCGFLGGKLGR